VGINLGFKQLGNGPLWVIISYPNMIFIIII
jgi:hypothetical protein